MILTLYQIHIYHLICKIKNFERMRTRRILFHVPDANCHSSRIMEIWGRIILILLYVYIPTQASVSLSVNGTQIEFIAASGIFGPSPNSLTTSGEIVGKRKTFCSLSERNLGSECLYSTTCRCSNIDQMKGKIVVLQITPAYQCLQTYYIINALESGALGALVLVSKIPRKTSPWDPKAGLLTAFVEDVNGTLIDMTRNKEVGIVTINNLQGNYWPKESDPSIFLDVLEYSKFTTDNTAHRVVVSTMFIILLITSITLLVRRVLSRYRNTLIDSPYLWEILLAMVIVCCLGKNHLTN
jgi:hypothetical protein